jgi:hypothetical protein
MQVFDERVEFASLTASPKILEFSESFLFISKEYFGGGLYLHKLMKQVIKNEFFVKKTEPSEILRHNSVADTFLRCFVSFLLAKQTFFS